jgi:hypothetical protein
MKKPPGQKAQEVSANTGWGVRLGEKEQAYASAHCQPCSTKHLAAVKL